MAYYFHRGKRVRERDPCNTGKDGKRWRSVVRVKGGDAKMLDDRNGNGRNNLAREPPRS
jgi:hypothetical protein